MSAVYFESHSIGSIIRHLRGHSKSRGYEKSQPLFRYNDLCFSNEFTAYIAGFRNIRTFVT